LSGGGDDIFTGEEMKGVLACAVGIVLGSGSLAAWAESVNTVPTSIASKPNLSANPVTSPKPSKAERLTDAQLDSVTAGTADILKLPGLHIVTNPGNASHLKSLNNLLLIIN
jgi:hypothetical protein